MTTVKLAKGGHLVGGVNYPEGKVVADADTNRAAYLVGMGCMAANDGIPVNTVAPSVSRNGVVVTTGAEGDVLVCSPGEWEGLEDGGAGDDEIALTYQWQSDAVNIGGATSNSFTVTATESGTDVTCIVTGTNDEGSDTGTSQAVAIA